MDTPRRAGYQSDDVVPATASGLAKHGRTHAGVRHPVQQLGTVDRLKRKRAFSISNFEQLS